jgi:spore coat polysaccharide biosynthesis protein SpsF
LIERIGRLPQNVVLIQPNEPLSSYGLRGITDLILGYTTTVGLEAAGCNISGRMVEQARKNFAEAGLPSDAIGWADAEDSVTLAPFVARGRLLLWSPPRASPNTEQTPLQAKHHLRVCAEYPCDSKLDATLPDETVTENTPDTNADHLEQLWSDEFGDAYAARNVDAWQRRGPFWRELLSKIKVGRVLEVGCNVGANLHWLSEILAPSDVFGVDVNEEALARARVLLPRANVVLASARELPFRDRWFDLVFTAGVLIHLPSTTLPRAMGEIVRCSARYVLCAEYFADEPTEVQYRGEHGALFKRDFGGLYEELSPDLRLLEQGYLGRDEGWDDVTWWLFERP